MNRPLKILLVQANPSHGQTICQAVARCPINSSVISIESSALMMDYLLGQGIWANVTPSQPDLILLEWNQVPVLDHKALDELKADPSLRLIPVVVLTNSREEKDVASVYRSGGTSFIVKPPDLETMTAVMATLLQYWATIVQLPTRIMA
jgi:CheY-like chemotaxis protein